MRLQALLRLVNLQSEADERGGHVVLQDHVALQHGLVLWHSSKVVVDSLARAAGLEDHVVRD